MQCLCVDFLNVDQLHDLHARCLATANQHNSKLIVEYPSDFFQVKLSYVYTKDEVKLVLHIPTVPTDTLLWLMRYWWFPIPLCQDDLSTGIIPRLDCNVLTISNGKEKTFFVSKVFWPYGMLTAQLHLPLWPSWSVGSIRRRFVHWSSLLAASGCRSNALPYGSGKTNWGLSAVVWKLFRHSE